MKMRQHATAVECPECGVVIPVPVTVTLDPKPTITDGDAVFTAICDADLADVWAHAWTHEEPT